MAIRAPTGFTKWLDANAYRSAEPILDDFDDTLNDQSYMLHHEQIIVSDCFWRCRCDTDDPAYLTVGTYNLDGIDKCAAAAVGVVAPYRFAVYCKCDTGTTGNIKLTTGSDSQATAITNTTWDWIGTNAVSMQRLAGAAGTSEETITLSINRTSGSGYVWAAGLIVTAEDTA